MRGGGAECFVATKDVLIVVRNLWSNYPSIYNPHEAPTLVSVMLFKEISELYLNYIFIINGELIQTNEMCDRFLQYK